MLHYVRRHHVALLALFVALGGTSYAVIRLPARSVGTRQLQNNAVTGAKVKNGSLKAVDFANGQLPAGATGPQGPKGDSGATGPQGPAGADGSAVAYAYVNNAAGGQPSFDAPRTKGFTSVAKGTFSGWYCLAPVTGIDASKHPAVVSLVYSSGQVGVPWGAVLGTASDGGCPAGDYAVWTTSNNSGVYSFDFEIAVL
jgi:hypothetical protein